MKYFISLCALFFLAIFKVNAQDTDQKILRKITELQNSGVDTIVSYHPYCNGRIPVLIAPTDTAKCHPVNLMYLVWKSKGINYFQRFDECYIYATISGKSHPVTNLLALHYSVIKLESIKPVNFRKKFKGRWQHLTVIQDHSCHADFVFYVNGKTISKKLTNFNSIPGLLKILTLAIGRK